MGQGGGNQRGGCGGSFSIFFSFFKLTSLIILFFFFLKKRQRRYRQLGIAKGPQADSRRVGGNTGAAGRDQGQWLLWQSRRSSVPPSSPKSPPPCTSYIQSPLMALLRSRPWGARGRGGGRRAGNATGPNPGHHPSAAGYDPSWRRLRGRAGSTGKALSITSLPTQTQTGLGMCNPAAGGCPANPSHRTQGGRGGGSLGCARPQHTASAHRWLPGHVSHC